MPPDLLSAHTETKRKNVVFVARKATLWSVFFSLRGSLPRDQWRWAMIAAVAAFAFVVSLLIGNGGADHAAPEWAGPSWPLFAGCFAVLGIATLLCAKRLLDCRRPMWLALPVPGPGVFMIAALTVAAEHAWPTLAVITAYSALFALPGLIACAICEADD